MSFRAALFLSGMALIGYGCSSPHQQMALRYYEGETELYLETRIIKIVQQWYAPHSENIRVVVKSRSPAGWILAVGPEMKATTVEINPVTLEVTNVWPGY